MKIENKFIMLPEYKGTIKETHYLIASYFSDKFKEEKCKLHPTSNHPWISINPSDDGKRVVMCSEKFTNTQLDYIISFVRKQHGNCVIDFTSKWSVDRKVLKTMPKEEQIKYKDLTMEVLFLFIIDKDVEINW